MPASERPPEPWHAFLAALDAALTQEVSLHRIGGFVLTACYEMKRPTADVKHLVKTVPLDLQRLKQRYEEELRPAFVGNADRADATMKLWLEAFSELR